MTGFSIRRYKKSDYDAVRFLFAQGAMEHFPATYFYLLKLPQIQVTLFIPFVILFLVSKSYTLPFVSLTVLLAAGWYVVKSFYNRHVNKCQSDDLLDIEKSYMRNSHACFFVAESNGEVVGIVGVQPVQNCNKAMELKRLSVADNHRMQGIAKALCIKVIEFAKQHGYKRVNLNTSMIQQAACKLYERMGFEKTNVKVLPSFHRRFTNISIFYYTYHIENE